jgi:hypothetical protein
MSNLIMSVKGNSTKPKKVVVIRISTTIATRQSTEKKIGNLLVSY